MKVLVPLDGSEISMAAMEGGLRLLDGRDAEVTLLCIRAKGFDDADPDRREIFEEDPDDQIFASNNEANAMLDDAEARCKGLGRDVERKIIVGNHPGVIQAEASDYDLLIMHRLTKESIKEKLRMSQAEHIVRTVDCAVLLV